MAVVTAACKNCQKQFKSNTRYIRKTCSAECFSENTKKEQYVTPKTKPCNICNIRFKPANQKQKSCSVKCGNISKIKPRQIKKCAICNNVHSNKLAKTCSSACKHTLMSRSKQLNDRPKTLKPELTLSCMTCSNEFTVPRKQRNRKTCSDVCFRARMAEQARQHKTKPPLECTCTICETKFQWKRTGKSLTRLTCSDDCLQELRTANSGYGKKFDVDDSNGISVRLDSSWEKEVCDYLVEHNVSWVRPKPLMWVDCKK